MKKLDETAFTERELKIFKEIQEYAKKYQTKKVVLFGSRARRTNREKSDIDLAVYGCSDVTEFYFDIDEEVNMILSILVYTFFTRMFDFMLPLVVKYSIVAA